MIRALPILLAAALLTAAPLRAARADNVTVTVSGGTLKIKGDADANTVTLDQAAVGANELRVTGGPTTINGSAGPVVFQNVTGGLQIDLGAGDDTVTLDELSITGAVKIKLGTGTDTVTAPSSSFHNSVSIDLGSGDNVLALCDTTVDGSLGLKVGAGTGTVQSAVCGAHTVTAPGSALLLDAVTVEGGVTLKGSKATEVVAFLDGTIGDTARLALGGGSDSLSLCTTDFDQALSVQIGRGVAGVTATAGCGGPLSVVGENALDIEHGRIDEAFTLKMGASADAVAIVASPIGEAAKIDLGQGTNTLTLQSNVGEALTLKSGKGDDTIEIKNASIGENASVNAGAGANNIKFIASGIGENLTVLTGKGDDTIDTTGATVGGSTNVKHGKGTDTVTP